jgi:hypothetical protein
MPNTTAKDCTFCNHRHIGEVATTQLAHSQANNMELKIQNRLSTKYASSDDYNNVKIVNDLIYNENTHVVSIFKDYLILDDINEFLKRSYTKDEAKTRLPKLCNFYEMYSQVFPNFVCLPESKYMFKNIQKKQKLIDEQYQIQEMQAKKALEAQGPLMPLEDPMFSSNFINSVMG